MISQFVHKLKKIKEANEPSQSITGHSACDKLFFSKGAFQHDIASIALSHSLDTADTFLVALAHAFSVFIFKNSISAALKLKHAAFVSSFQSYVYLTEAVSVYHWLLGNIPDR